MPTYEPTESFLQQYSRLTKQQRAEFRRAVAKFVEDIGRDTFRPGFRVKGIQGMPGCFEMTWAANGGAIFTYGPEVLPGEPHIVWLAIGTHAILP